MVLTMLWQWKPTICQLLIVDTTAAPAVKYSCIGILQYVQGPGRGVTVYKRRMIDVDVEVEREQISTE